MKSAIACGWWKSHVNRGIKSTQDPHLADADAHLSPNHKDQTAEHSSFLHAAHVSYAARTRFAKDSSYATGCTSLLGEGRTVEIDVEGNALVYTNRGLPMGPTTAS